MDFRHLIDIYGKSINIQQNQSGDYVDGKWVSGTPSSETITGILLEFTSKDFNKATEGKFTTDDRKLIVKNEDALLLDEFTSDGKEAYIVDNSGNTLYEITSYTDFSGFGNITKYIAKRVVE